MAALNFKGRNGNGKHGKHEIMTDKKQIFQPSRNM